MKKNQFSKSVLKCFLAWGIVTMSVCSSAYALQREDYALEVPVSGADGSALVSVNLPLDVYLAARKPALGDLRMINGAAEAIPFAIARPAPLTQAAQVRTVTLLPFYAKTTESISGNEAVSLTKSGDTINLTISADKKSSTEPAQVLRAYYADLGGPTSLRSLKLNLAPGEDLNASVTIEASDDLKAWRTLASGAPIFRLTRQTQNLINTDIEITTQSARYLRLTWSSSAAALVINDLTVQTATLTEMRAPTWINLNGQAATEKQVLIANTFDYDAGAALPISRVNLVFVDANTLAPVRILARAQTSEVWQELRSENFYRMNIGVAPNLNQAINPDVILNSNTGEYRYWRIQIDPRAGEFQSKIPTLKLGFIPSRVVFTARGNAPFALLVGNAQIESASLAMDNVAPSNAVISEAQLVTAQAVKRSGLGAKVIDRSGEQQKQWILWIALIVGVGALAFVAMRLLKEPAK